MKILFLSRWYPWPADNGSKIRIANMLKHLSSLHDVALVSFVEGSADGAVHLAPGDCEVVRTVPYQRFSPWRARSIVGFLDRRPRSVVDTYSQAMATNVRTVANTFDPDLVIASQLDMAPYALLVPGAKRILEEVELTVPYDAMVRAPDSRTRLRRELTWWKHAQYVRGIARQFEACTVVSEQEYVLLRNTVPGLRRGAILPNGVDVQELGGDFGAPLADTLIYAGALTYSANFDAVQYFVREILPLIVRQRPAVQFVVTGSTKGVAVGQLGDSDHVTLAGYLPDVRPAVARSAVSVVPLRIGGGTRLKILESLALGTPVVCTTKGIEGIDLAAGEGVLMADTPQEFAASVVHVLAEPALRAELSARGRRAVQKYDWALIGQMLNELIDEVAQTEGLVPA